MILFRVFFVFSFMILVDKVAAQVKWLTFEEAIIKAEANPKPIFVDVYTDWCGWCKKMDRETFAEESISKILQQDFYAVKFNAEQRESITFNNHTFNYIQNGRRGSNELAVALLDGKLSYPSVVFLNEKMERIMVLPGYRGPKEFYPILGFISSGAYQHKTFKEYTQ